jgi:hypothetical protein
MKKSELEELIREAIAQAVPPTTKAAPTGNGNEKVTIDASTADDIIDKSPAVSRALKRINTGTEFKDLFVKLMGDLGIRSTDNPDKTKVAVPKGTLIAAITKALGELHWK